MRHINPKKLLGSKWTARQPKDKEKHFIVGRVVYDDAQEVSECYLEAIISHREFSITWQDLKNSDIWLQGWQSS